VAKEYLRIQLLAMNKAADMLLMGQFNGKISHYNRSADSWTLKETLLGVGPEDFSTGPGYISDDNQLFICFSRDYNSITSPLSLHSFRYNQSTGLFGTETVNTITMGVHPRPASVSCDVDHDSRKITVLLPSSTPGKVSIYQTDL
jgi:hypothetical protein